MRPSLPATLFSPVVTTYPPGTKRRWLIPQPSRMTPDQARSTSNEAVRAAAMDPAWAAPHHAPPHGGSKDRSGLRFPLAHLSVRRSPCSRRGAGRPGGVPRPFLDGDQQSSPLQNPLPGHAHLSRSPWASAKQLASRPMATSASPSSSAAAASRSRSSAICPWLAPMPSPASCRAHLAPRCR